jgi:hypothetical protein
MFVRTRYMGLCPFSGAVLPEDICSSLWGTALPSRIGGRHSAAETSLSAPNLATCHPAWDG